MSFSGEKIQVAKEPIRLIWVTFSLEGFHCYPDAPKEVSYLRLRHRHQFGFKVGISVTETNREVEFHMFKTWLLSLYQGALEMNNKSCEMIADDLAAKIEQEYGSRKMCIEVHEDGECGVTQYYNWD